MGTTREGQGRFGRGSQWQLGVLVANSETVGNEADSYTCIHVYVYVDIYVCFYVYTYTHICIYIYIHICVYVYVYV